MDKIIGYTSGVFDLFHIGHLNILKRAKEQCAYLIVAVSTDELVQSYKNKLPVIPFNERKSIVESIKHVDKVVAQETRNKIEAWVKYKFNIMFVGDDWKDNELFVETEKRFKEFGVKVIYLPYTKNTSSTLIKKYLEDETHG
ncbi:adenylyltransferase/cytidyltransferase family protein [Treponema primitia]|uniref:adenylyltransferase/cytidyltransferase family protein n=1 Tax=Treponema primitia TaxID=88058 RepID=UPI0002554EDD|nr:adenylyltransferase/cytidyltransferase family protein [Treponema primitia]